MNEVTAMFGVVEFKGQLIYFANIKWLHFVIIFFNKSFFGYLLINLSIWSYQLIYLLFQNPENWLLFPIANYTF